jgi:hypothetical protein
MRALTTILMAAAACAASLGCIRPSNAARVPASLVIDGHILPHGELTLV